MPISVYIDHNVWHFLYARGLRLAQELPHPDFCIAVTREAGFEIAPTPEPIRSFIEKTLSECVMEDNIFGFYDESLPPHLQRVAGLDEGRFATADELAFMAQQKTLLRPSQQKLNPKTNLYGNEADIAIAARAFHSIVLTCDRKGGPLRDAREAGGKVVYLSDMFDTCGLSLREFVLREAGISTVSEPDLDKFSGPYERSVY